MKSIICYNAISENDCERLKIISTLIHENRHFVQDEIKIGTPLNYFKQNKSKKLLFFYLFLYKKVRSCNRDCKQKFSLSSIFFSVARLTILISISSNSSRFCFEPISTSASKQTMLSSLIPTDVYDAFSVCLIFITLAPISSLSSLSTACFGFYPSSINPAGTA